MKYVCADCEWSVPVDGAPDMEAMREMIRHKIETKHSGVGTVEALQKPPTGERFEGSCTDEEDGSSLP